MKALGIKVLWVVVLLGLVALSFSKLEPPQEPIEVQEKPIMVEVKRKDGSIDQVALEEYIMGVVSAEMPASFEMEALKAQAVASRTFVLSRALKVDDTVSSQVYYDKQQRQVNWGADFETYESKIEEAVRLTAGEVMTYEGQYISALFFASSNGKTENNEDYFVSANLPYLQSVDSSWDLAFAQTYRHKTFSKAELNSIFETTDFTIEILTYTESGRVESVDVCGKIYSGREIREKLSLASNDFDVSKEGDNYVFETIGYGHGVGMSQYGACGMAMDGYDYQAILHHYYQGVTIEKITEN